MMRSTIITLTMTVLLFLSCRSDGILINVTFDELAGLEEGDRVLYEGNVAGRVKNLQLDDDGRYTVQIEIDEGFANAATEHSRFHLAEDSGIEGRKAIDIQRGQAGGKPLSSGASVKGEPLHKDFANRIQEELEAGMGFFKEKIEKFSRDLQAIPEHEEVQELKKYLEDLAAEIEKKKKETRERVKKEWLPKIQRELDALRERLRQQGREDDMAPLDREVDRIRKI